MPLQRKSGAGKSHSSGDNHMRYSDDEGDGMGNPDDLDDLEGGTAMQPHMTWDAVCLRMQ